MYNLGETKGTGLQAHSTLTNPQGARQGRSQKGYLAEQKNQRVNTAALEHRGSELHGSTHTWIFFH